MDFGGGRGLEFCLAGCPKVEELSNGRVIGSGRKGRAARGDARGPKGDFYLCCNNCIPNLPQQRGWGTVGDFGRGVYSGSWKKLYLIFHGRNASASVGTVTVNGCWSTLTAHKPPAHPQE